MAGHSLGGLDCAIVGGGVVGLMTALRLGSSGWRVAVFERDRLGAGATSSNHGIVHSGALFAPLHPEIVRDCYAAQAGYESSFPAAVVDTQPAWYVAKPERLASLEKLWAKLGIPHAEVDAAELAELLVVAGTAGVRAARVRELIISTHLLLSDLAARCAAAGVELLTAAPAGRVITENGSVAGVALGATGFAAARHVVLCSGIGTSAILQGSGSGLWARLRSRLDMMVSLPNLALRRPILGLEYGWPTIAPAHGGVALASRYGGAQPPVAGFARWPVPVKEATALLDELSRLLRPGLLDFGDAHAWVCSKTEYAAGAADRWGVEPNYAVIDHGATENIRGLWTVLPGKMTLALHASQGVAARLTHREHPLELAPPPVPPARSAPEQLTPSPWMQAPTASRAGEPR